MARDQQPAKMAASRYLIFSRAGGWKSLGNGRTARMFYSIATIRKRLLTLLFSYSPFLLFSFSPFLLFKCNISPSSSL